MGRSATLLHPQSAEALAVLGGTIRAQRVLRGMTQQQVADWFGYSRDTVRSIEAGDQGVSIGRVFNVAVHVGVPLFGMDAEELHRAAHDTTRLTALLQQRVVPAADEVDDDF